MRASLAPCSHRVKTIAILDGVLYIAGWNRMFAELARFDDNEVVVSAVLLRDYLFSV